MAGMQVHAGGTWRPHCPQVQAAARGGAEAMGRQSAVLVRMVGLVLVGQLAGGRHWGFLFWRTDLE